MKKTWCVLFALLLCLSGCRGTPSEPTEKEENSPYAALLATNQTHHNEVSAENADVEALLATDPTYDYTEDYQIYFRSSSSTATAPSGVPSFSFGEEMSGNGILGKPVSEKEPNASTSGGRACRNFLYRMGKDTNQFVFRLDDTCREVWRGKTFSLHLIVKVEMESTFTLRYQNTAGKNVIANGTEVGSARWSEVEIPIVSPALAGSYDGYDFHLTMSGAGLIRVSEMWIEEDAFASCATLAQTTFDTPYQIVADVNVKEFGAKGNGKTDDTAAFLAAIAAAESFGGGTVYVPAGYYCLTRSLTLPLGVGLIGDLEQGTANGTVLMIYGGKGQTDIALSAVRLHHNSSVQNIAFWYPEQTIVNGLAIPYPPTVAQIDDNSLTIRNVTFVNSYIGLYYSSATEHRSLQYTRDVYGTCLSLGFENEYNYDIGKIENFHLSPSYWLDSGLPGTPNADLLKTYLSRHAVGLSLLHIDWTYFSDVFIDHYYQAVLGTYRGVGITNGHMLRFFLTDCTYCICGDALNWLLLTDCVLTSPGGDASSCPVYTDADCGCAISFVNCSLISSGKSAVVDEGSSLFSFSNCEILGQGSRNQLVKSKNALGVGASLSESPYGSATVESYQISSPLPDYAQTVVTKPASDRLVCLQEEPYCAKSGEDITERLQAALDSLKSTGGTVYLGAGTFSLSDHIDVWQGIELRGVCCWANNLNVTQIVTSFGRGDANGTPLITLYSKAGIIGICFNYPEQTSPIPCSFTIQGHGDHIYIVDVAATSSWNAVDFATYRCDYHYVEFLWGVAINRVIQVGKGSVGGIIRDCHLNPSCFLNGYPRDSTWWDDVFIRHTMAHAQPYYIGESEGEILYHNFTYGALEGVTLERNAENVLAVGMGVDSGAHSIALYGNTTATFIDTQLVTLTASDKNYIYADTRFTGTASFYNTACWGDVNTSFALRGSGCLSLVGGIVKAAGEPFVIQKRGDLLMTGLICTPRQTLTVSVGKNVKSCRIFSIWSREPLVFDNPYKIKIDLADATDP